MKEGRIEKQELIARVAARVEGDPVQVESIVEATLDEIYQALKAGEVVSLRNFGTFYVRPERASWVFRFNPSQKWRSLFGWSSTYTGEQ
jgi:DNA-binding protein HU-beta